MPCPIIPNPKNPIFAGVAMIVFGGASPTAGQASAEIPASGLLSLLEAATACKEITEF